MIMKLGMEHYVLKLFKVCINDDPGLTLIDLFYDNVKFGETCFCTYSRPMQISGECLQDHWSSGLCLVLCFNSNTVFNYILHKLHSRYFGKKTVFMKQEPRRHPFSTYFRQNNYSVKCRSRALGKSACSKNRSRQLLCKVSHSQLSMLQRNTHKFKTQHKILTNQRSMKCRSGAQGHGVYFKSMTKTIIMQCFKLTAINTTEKHTLILNSM